MDDFVLCACVIAPASSSSNVLACPDNKVGAAAACAILDALCHNSTVKDLTCTGMSLR